MKTADFEIQGLVFERKSGVVFKPEFAVGKLPILIFWDLNSISLRFSAPHPNLMRNIEIWTILGHLRCFHYLSIT